MMDPILQNLLATLFTVFLLVAALSTCDRLLKSKILPSHLTRKVWIALISWPFTSSDSLSSLTIPPPPGSLPMYQIVHITAGSWLISWPLFNPNHWTWMLNVAVPLGCALRLAYLGLLSCATPSQQQIFVRLMSRSGDRKELAQGPLLFTLLMVFVGLFLFSSAAGVMAMAAVGWGDGLAPIFGYYASNRRDKTGKKIGARYTYQTFGRPKTLEGSLACFVGCVVGGFVLHAVVLMGELPPCLPLWAVATVTTMVEALSPSDIDNILIPIFAVITWNLLQ